jgi:hypothetical protein
VGIRKGVIEAHGGIIWAESDCYDEIEFPGTTFHIMLPILKQPPDGSSTEMIRTSAGSNDFDEIYAQHLESSG